MRLLAASAITVLALVACEVAGRLFVPATWSPRMFSARDVPPGFALRSGYRARSGRTELSIDAGGRRFVAGSTPLARAREVHVIGDAQVFGLGLSDERTIPSRLQTLLGPAYRVVNDGVPGYGPFEYASEALRLRGDALAIVLLSERDDLRNAYFAAPRYAARCGYLVERDAHASGLPCPLLASGIARGIAYLRARLRNDAAALPLEYDVTSTFAARVLGLRVRRLLEGPQRRLATRLILSYVPWAGSIEEAWFPRRDPRAAAVRSSARFIDEAGVSKALERASGERYQNDGYLSGTGADVVASALAAEVLRRAQMPAASAALRNRLL